MPRLEMASTKDWIGCLISSRISHNHQLSAPHDLWPSFPANPGYLIQNTHWMLPQSELYLSKYSLVQVIYSCKAVFVFFVIVNIFSKRVAY